MSQTDPTVELNEQFSEPSASARPWAEVAEMLSQCKMFWLSTVRRDGRPHVAPLPAIWQDATLHFCTGSYEQKAKNLQSNPACILTAGANQFHSGLDVVVEGIAARITDPARLQRLATLWKSELDWDFQATDDGFRDPAGRSGSIFVFAVTPTKVLAFGKSPYSQTRYRFTT